MIEGNIIKFGYGDILVGVDSMFGGMIFDFIKPPQDIGKTCAKKDVEVLRTVQVGNGLSAIKLLENLQTVSADNPKIDYLGYTLDFSKFNEESLNVCKRQAKRAQNIGLPLAC